jgi:hypothetical protein
MSYRVISPRIPESKLSSASRLERKLSVASTKESLPKSSEK